MSSDVNAANLLREEARESWDCVVSNEILCAIEDSHIENRTISNLRHSDNNPGTEEWFEVRLRIKRHGHMEFYMVIVEAVDDHELSWTESRNSDLTWGDTDDLMLVGIRQVIDEPQHVFIRLPATIRLKRLHPFSDGFRRIRPLLDPLIESSDVFFFKYGEGAFDAGLVCCEQGQLPGQVIQGGSQVCGPVSDQQPETNIGFLPPMNPVDVEAVLRLLVTVGMHRVAIKECLDFSLESVEVFLRSREFEPHSLKWIATAT